MAGITKDTPRYGGNLRQKCARRAFSPRDRSRDAHRFRWGFDYFCGSAGSMVLRSCRRRRSSFQYGLTTVHHDEAGVLPAMQEQRIRGGMSYRASYEPYDELLEAIPPASNFR